jgi:hypothetical protein
MASSELLSLFALFTSVVLGLLNYLYTRRTFRARNFPSLLCELHPSMVQFANEQQEPTAIKQTHFRFELQNLSSDIAISQIEMTARVKPYSRTNFIKRGRMYCSKKTGVLMPAQVLHDMYSPCVSIETFIEDNFAEILQKEQIGESDKPVNALVAGGTARLGDKELFHYLVLREQLFWISLTVLYQPGILGSPLCRERKLYSLKPIYISPNDETPILFSWAFEEIHKFGKRRHP